MAAVLLRRRTPSADRGGFMLNSFAAAIIRAMTLLEITFELQSPLSLEQLCRLGAFANTYGLRSFRVDEQHNQLTFEYDASRLRETQVAHVLGQAGIAVLRKVN